MGGFVGWLMNAPCPRVCCVRPHKRVPTTPTALRRACQAAWHIAAHARQLVQHEQGERAWGPAIEFASQRPQLHVKREGQGQQTTVSCEGAIGSRPRRNRDSQGQCQLRMLGSAETQGKYLGESRTCAGLDTTPWPGLWHRGGGRSGGRLGGPLRQGNRGRASSSSRSTHPPGGPSPRLGGRLGSRCHWRQHRRSYGRSHGLGGSWFGSSAQHNRRWRGRR